MDHNDGNALVHPTTRYDGLGTAKYQRPVRLDGTDQPGGKHDGCRLFVLDLTHDGAARVAVARYCDLVEDSRPVLCRDMRMVLKSLPPLQGPSS